MKSDYEDSETTVEKIYYVRGAMRLPDFVRPNNTRETELFKYAQNEFVYGIINTITSFEKILAQPYVGSTKKSGYCVLVLPTMSKWATFITNAVLRELFTSLTAISIGPTLHLRLVICHEDLLQRKIMKDFLAMDMEQLKVIGRQTDGAAEENQVNTTAEDVIIASEDLTKTAGTTSEDTEQGSLTQLRLSSQGVNTKLIGSRILDEPVSRDEEVFKDYQPIADDLWTSLMRLHLSDIVDSVGPVWVMKPDWSQLEVTDICPNFDSGEMDHALEVYDFPATFSTEDISRIFKEFEEWGFSISWTDDTHAVIRFASKEIADRALTSIQHPLLQCRPVASASRQTKMKLAGSSDRRLPFKRRPQTESNTAKRLILSSLGIRPERPRRPPPKDSLPRPRQ